MKGQEGGITNSDAVIGFQRITLGWDNAVYTVGHQTRLDRFEDMNGQLSIIIPSLLHMNVHSYDCDNFTKEFYRINFGIEDFTPIQVAQPPPPAVKQVSIAISYTVDSIKVWLCTCSYSEPAKPNLPHANLILYRSLIRSYMYLKEFYHFCFLLFNHHRVVNSVLKMVV